MGDRHARERLAKRQACKRNNRWETGMQETGLVAYRYARDMTGGRQACKRQDRWEAEQD